MKFLLTSNGLSTPAISRALFGLVGKPSSETFIAFIPTAMNVESGSKDWFINDLENILKQGVDSLDIVDISALPKEVWLPRLEAADVLFFSGGNSPHLMRWIIESGLREILPDLLATKVWAGISAGSMVVSPTLILGNKDKQIYYESVFGYSANEGLGLVDLYIRPHLNSPDFPHATKDYLDSVAEEVAGKIYALDDWSAITVVDGKVEVISDGEYLVLN